MDRERPCPDTRHHRPNGPLADWLWVAFVGLLLGVAALGWAATVGGVIPA